MWPEVRTEPALGRRVLVAPERAARPVGEDGAPCPFCPGNESETPAECAVWSDRDRGANTPGWQVRVFPNRYPALVSGPVEPRAGHTPALGRHEVLVETPDHHAHPADWSVPHWRSVLDAWADRLAAAWTETDAAHVVLFKNHGARAGATRAHPHSQLMALPFVSDVRRREIAAWSAPCPWCVALPEQALKQGRMVHDGPFAVWCAQAPVAAHETWLVPRNHDTAFHTLSEGSRTQVATLVRTLLRVHRAVLGASGAFNLILHTARNAHEPGPHWRLELLPKTAAWGGFEQATGHALIDVAPEAAARAWRTAWSQA